jgi:5-(hydroxymethyl)furfural/furfural oxidase
MGADGDPMAVVDAAGRVRGVDGLRVVDASVFPVVPSANTNFPTLMTAEKMADAILSQAA